jgi:hypothetical protein
MNQAIQKTLDGIIKEEFLRKESPGKRCAPLTTAFFQGFYTNTRCTRTHSTYGSLLH